MKQAKDLSNMNFGLWHVLKRAPNRNGRVYWICRCQCKNKTIKEVSAHSLLNGSSKSCGCLNMKRINKYNKIQRKCNDYKIIDDYVIFFKSTNKEFIIDLSDLETVLELKRCWFIHKDGYVICKYKGKEIRLHNYLLKPQAGYMVDHIDGNPRNNRRYNLRICKEIDNAKNKKTPTNNTSGVKGVNWDNKENAWHVRIGYNNKRIFLGYFTDFNEAVKTRKEAEKKYFGEFKNDR